jgi:predicted PolB exonuclease-like 3'-5' exonuclease
MKPFAAIAVTTAPDIASARRLYDLGDLDDSSVVKVLLHKSKQAGGERLGLRPHAQCVAAVSLVAAADDGIEIWTRTAVEHAEPVLLRKLFDAAHDLDALISWGGDGFLPVLRLRAMAHGQRARAFFRLAGGEGHLDLARRLDPAGTGVTLGELAVVQGLPGLQGTDGADAGEALRAGDVQALRARGELRALNLLLLGLRYWRTEGAVSGKRAAQVERRVHEALGDAEPPHLRNFVAAWPVD